MTYAADNLAYLIPAAIAEDIGTGDITTDALVPSSVKGEGAVVAKEPVVVAGLEAARRVFEYIDPAVRFEKHCNDGDAVEKGAVIFSIAGAAASLLKAERTALNFLQRLSGIATHVRGIISQIEGQTAGKKMPVILDTRKTTPGWRVLEKEAVRAGGGRNHRMGLFDGVLIKDNHIAVCGGVKEAVSRARRRIHHLVKIEVEASDFGQIQDALDAEAHVIMLDNMDVDQIKKAVAMIDGRALVEISGGITGRDLSALVETGADLISMGALTHSARSVDLSMRIKTANLQAGV